MKNKLRVDTVLDYFDQPILFLGRDDFDTMYLCLLYDDERYTGIRISASRLNEFENQKIDLLSLFSDPENKNEYFDILIDGDELEMTRIEDVDASRLPEPGYYLSAPAREKITVTIPVKDKSLFASIARRFGWIAM